MQCRHPVDSNTLIIKLCKSQFEFVRLCDLSLPYMKTDITNQTDDLHWYED